jgi:hypothetical protein
VGVVTAVDSAYSGLAQYVLQNFSVCVREGERRGATGSVRSDWLNMFHKIGVFEKGREGEGMS